LAGFLRRGSKSRGLRFRLTLSYVVFFTALLTLLGIFFYTTLDSVLHTQLSAILEEDWDNIQNYLRFEDGRPVWFFDRTVPEEAFTVERLRRVYLLTDSQGRVLEVSDAYRGLGVDSPAAIQKVLKSHEATWEIRKNEDGVSHMIRSGVVTDDAGNQYFLAIGRSLGDSHRILEQFTWRYFALIPLVSLGTGLLGWLMAGRALRPLNVVASTAQAVTSANLNVRIARRDADDELDHLIDSFNSMVDRLQSSFIQVRRFSTDASHELRTPLTAIRGQLEVALFSAKTIDEYREAMMNAMEDVERLSQIVRALLLLSQAESGQLAVRKDTVDISAIVHDAVEQFQIPAEMAGVTLTAEYPPQCLLEGDRIQIDRLVSNLLSNAIKYTPSGGQIRVSLSPFNGQISLVVEDTGRGIAPAHLPNIFDRFYRVPDAVPDADVNVDKGLGLGLSFVAWIVKAHGGKIDVESTLGQGTKFTVSLPMGNVAAPPAEPQTVTPEKN
jgi:heavy metal sensor kinase